MKWLYIITSFAVVILLHYSVVKRSLITVLDHKVINYWPTLFAIVVLFCPHWGWKRSFPSQASSLQWSCGRIGSQRESTELGPSPCCVYKSVKMYRTLMLNFEFIKKKWMRCCQIEFGGIHTLWGFQRGQLSLIKKNVKGFCFISSQLLIIWN